MFQRQASIAVVTVGVAIWGSLGCRQDARNSVSVTRSGLTPGWTPHLLDPSTQAWFTAAAGVTTDPHNSSVVSTWTDQLHGTVLQGSGSPQYRPDGWGTGVPTITFSGGQLLRTATAWSGVPTGTEPAYTILAVLRSAAPQTATVAGWWDPNGQGYAWVGLKQVGTLSFFESWRVYSNAPGEAFAGALDAGTTAHVVAWRYDPGTGVITQVIDGVPASSSAMPGIGPLPAMPLIVGARSLLPTGLFQGDISELRIVARALGDDEIQNYMEYSRSQWHITTPAPSANPCLDANNHATVDPIAAATRCDDGDPKTYGDHCAAGVCVGSVPPAGSPAELSPVAWYHANPQEVVVSEGGVSTWFDRTQNHRDLMQPFYYGRPALSSTWLGGKPALHFSGGQGLRRDAWSGSPLGASQPFTILAVFQPGTAGQSASIASWWNASSSHVYASLTASNGDSVPTVVRAGESGATQSLTDPVALGTTPHAVVWRYGPDSLTVTVDGQSIPPRAFPALDAIGASVFLVGMQTYLPTGLFTGDLAELAVVPGRITDDQVGAFQSYVTQEWGGLVCHPGCSSCGGSDYCGGTCTCGAACTAPTGPCANGLECADDGTCQLHCSIYPRAPECQPDHCKNGVRDADETAVDCGGASCTTCITVTLDKQQVQNGDTIHIAVQADDRSAPGHSPKIFINGTPVSAMYDQIVSGAGQHLFSVTVVNADGTEDSTLATVPVVPSNPPGPPAVPVLVADTNYYHPDQVDFTVVNAVDFDDGTAVYTWTFGDGTQLTGPAAAVTHDYAASLPSSVENRAFDVTVSVTHASLPATSTTRTFVVWNAYASRPGGVLEPPVEPVDPVLVKSGSDLTGTVTLGNRESVPITYNSKRLDFLPCDGDQMPSYGQVQSTSITVPPGSTASANVQVAASALDTGTSGAPRMCGVAVHYWGATSTGTPAQVSAWFDKPSPPGAGVRADAMTNALLNAAQAKNLLSNPFRVTEEDLIRLYRERKIGYSSATNTFFQSAGATDPGGDACDPENPGPPSKPGFTCQFTGLWSGHQSGDQALAGHIQNAQKGDAILVRGCAGFVGPLLNAVDPPQRFTHTGIMTKNRYEIRETTGNEDWLRKHPVGAVGQPTNGFEEQALRYLWPGTLTATVEEAFGAGRCVQRPNGDEPEDNDCGKQSTQMRISGFVSHETRCANDSTIVYPQVLKPAPELDSMVRAKLMSAAEFSKGINGHYRFSNYSNAPDTPAPDPNGPFQTGSPPVFDAYGPTPTVCSSFVRFALKGAGFQLDNDKSFPLPSDVRRNPPDGIFYYDAQERLNAANVLYQGIYDSVETAVAEFETKTDQHWYVGFFDGPLGPEVNPLSPDNLTNAFKVLSDLPDDVANQVTNCFASDYCSKDAKDSDRWKKPGAGFAVSPDDMMNFFDSPLTGGPYGYHERMAFRGRDYEPVYEWLPAVGSISIHGTVQTDDGQLVPFAQVSIPGFTDPGCDPFTDPNCTVETISTLPDGTFSIDGVPRGNIRIDAQKTMGNPSTGALYQGDACYKPASTDPNSNELLSVSCDNFDTLLNPNAQTEVVVILQPPPPTFRHVVLDGWAQLSNCICENPFPNNATPSIYATCDVSPVHYLDAAGNPKDSRTAPLGFSKLCDDQLGVGCGGSCELLADDMTVRVTGTLNFYAENKTSSCGADTVVRQTKFQYDVSPGGSQHESWSPPSVETRCADLAICRDRLDAEFDIENQVTGAAP